jgi:imidazolonepropionase-like amidohydrolase
MRKVLAPLMIAAGLFCGSLPQTRPTEGLRDRTPRVHALVHARVIPSPGLVLEDATVVIRDGMIEAVGRDLQVPQDARIWDLTGKTIYPGLIDAYVAVSRLGTLEAPEGSIGTGHWNSRVHPETDVAEAFKPDPEKLKSYRQQGFTTALVVPDKGIFRGRSAVILLGEGPLNDLVIRRNVAQHLAFEQAQWGESAYPDSLMGAIALIRQTFLDAQWYPRAMKAVRLNPNQPRPEVNRSLEALQPVLAGDLPVMFEVTDDLNLLRARKIAEEFGIRLWVRGSGFEYRQADFIGASGIPLILPVNFPAPPKVETPEEALDVSLSALWHWEAAPSNPVAMMQRGAKVALTTSGLESRGAFREKLRDALDAGLEPDAALAAVTTIPARILGIDHLVGTIEKGRIANLVVTSGDLFEEDTMILDVWVAGVRYEVNQLPPVDLTGYWNLTIIEPEGNTIPMDVEVGGKAPNYWATITAGEKSVRAERVRLEDRYLALVFNAEPLGQTGFVRLSGYITAAGGEGKGELPDGRLIHWLLRRADAAKKVDSAPEDTGQTPPVKPQEESPLTASLARLNPPVEYWPARPPEQPHYLVVKNATIWTSGPAGVLKNADMVIHRGKIEEVGTNLKVPEGATIIDATGKHVTPGLIDAHSHTAISEGVNEVGQTITAEVRIGDVINPYDIGIYRELAGGLTVAHLLHGSANPIGGQNATIKLRWGEQADGLVFRGADPTIKFALGENPKQSNWGDQFTTRYPQTRMGVEQIIRDRFRAAQDYRRAWERWNSLPEKEQERTVPPRRDLELEALVEILEGKRKVHAHSYRQDEILMLMRVAEDFGFRIGTFQHVLEGYKVADVMAQHGAMASTFTDWWSYKIEVYDAIPYNGALMHDVGVVVSFNSDSGELARRLNTEAAKAVKYGGVPPEEALKFVTLNPAKQLGIADRVGSLEKGKDADFVIWSGDPLSVFSVCEQTWIEGRKYFDREEDAKIAEFVAKERARLIQKALQQRQHQRRKERQRLLEQQPVTESGATNTPTTEISAKEDLRGGRDP